jgi:hypothetical protein
VVVLGILALFPAAAARTHLVEARSALVEARGALIEGRSAVAGKAFNRARSELVAARARVRHPAIRIAGFLPFLGRTPDTTTALVEAGLRVAEAGQILSSAVEDLPGGLSALAPADGRIPLGPIRTLAEPLGDVSVLLEEAGRIMAEAPHSLLLPQVQAAVNEFGPLLEEARTGLGTAASLSRTLPGFLGGNGPRRYFVAAQNPAELRGTGGLIGSYSILTVRQGKLDFGDFRPVSELDTVPPARVAPPNPDYAAVWDRFSSRGYWSNINMTADFPSAATAIARLYRETEGIRLHGVIATDPFALASLLELVGPVTVPGTDVELSAANAVEYLTHGAYSSLPDRERKFVLGDVAEEVLSVFIDGPVGEASEPPAPGSRREGAGPGTGERGAVRGGRPPRGGQPGGTVASPSPSPTAPPSEEQGPRGPAIRGPASAAAFGRVLVDIAASGHLLLHSSHPEEQRSFAGAGVAGALPRGGGDFLGVVANAGSGTKLDFYLGRRVRYEVDLLEGGMAAGTATVELANRAPDRGQPPYVIGPHPFTDLRPGENFIYLSTYCATSCSLESFRRDGRPAGVAPHEELGHPVIQTTAQIPSEASQEQAFGWRVRDAWSGDSGNGTYRLVVDGQPGVRPLRLSLAIDAPDGMRVVAASPGMRVTEEGATWTGAVDDLSTFEISFQRPAVSRMWHEVLEFLGHPVFRLG